MHEVEERVAVAECCVDICHFEIDIVGRVAGGDRDCVMGSRKEHATEISLIASRTYVDPVKSRRRVVVRHVGHPVMMSGPAYHNNSVKLRGSPDPSARA